MLHDLQTFEMPRGKVTPVATHFNLPLWVLYLSAGIYSILSESIEPKPSGSIIYSIETGPRQNAHCSHE